MEVASLKKMKNKDILLTLPGTFKLRDISWLSIWCKRFTVNYGEVYIPKDIEIPEKVVSFSTLFIIFRWIIHEIFDRFIFGTRNTIHSFNQPFTIMT